MKTALTIRSMLLAGFLGLTALGSAHPAAAGLSVGETGHNVGSIVKDAGPVASETREMPNVQVAARACPSGLVWRERFDGDTVCVLPGERDENRRRRGLATGPASLCPSGLVWRERFDGDTVCVTPLERDENRRRRGL